MSDRGIDGKFAKGNQWTFREKPENINLNGRPKGRSLSDHLRKLLDDEENGENLADALVKMAVDRALRGDFKFWQEIMNRIDGRVPNTIAGADGSSLTFLIGEAVQSEDEQQEHNKD